MHNRRIDRPQMRPASDDTGEMTDTQHEPTPFPGPERDPLDELFDAEDDPRVDAVLHAVGARLSEGPDELTARRHLKAMRQAVPTRTATPLVRRLVLRTAAATGVAAALTLVLAFTGSLPAPAQQLASDTASRFGIQLPGAQAEEAEADGFVELPDEIPDHARIPEQVPVPGGQGQPDELPGPPVEGEQPRGLDQAGQRARGPLPDGELPPWVSEHSDVFDRAPWRLPFEPGEVGPLDGSVPGDAGGPATGDGTTGDTNGGGANGTNGASNGADNAQPPDLPPPADNGGR